jgi:hypothetical protein
MPKESRAEVSLLPPDYIEQANRDARRYQGQWTGTIGSMAAHVRRLLIEREELLRMLSEKTEVTTPGVSAIIEEAWAKYRENGPRERKVYGCDGDKPGTASQPPDFAPVRVEATPAEELCHRTAAVIRDRRPKYGGPKQHFARTIGMVNAAFADVLKRPLTEADWATIMILDKIARFRGPNATVDGPVDIAGYAACMFEVMDSPGT